MQKVVKMKRERIKIETAIVPVEGLDLKFSARRREAIYRRLLEELDEAPKNSALRVNCLKSRASVNKQARALGFKVWYAEKGGVLFCKIVGYVDGEKKSRSQGVEESRSLGVSDPVVMVLNALKDGPLVVKEIARLLGATPESCGPVLAKLVMSGRVEADAGVYRLKGAPRFAPTVRKAAGVARHA
jgi:predicted Rossmann fold nucleotide-binding protein DprA/Smf involved in DNA uptake